MVNSKKECYGVSISNFTKNLSTRKYTFSSNFQGPGRFHGIRGLGGIRGKL